MLSLETAPSPTAAAARGAVRRLIYVGDPELAGLPLDAIREAGWDVHVVGNPAAAQEALQANAYCVGLMQLPAGRSEVLQHAGELLQRGEPMEWIGLLRPEDRRSREVWRAVRDGFYDYHTLPADGPRLLFALGHACGMVRLKRQVAQEAGAGEFEMVGQSVAMRRLYAEMRRAATVTAPVLISGEEGTGKELVAQGLHRHSPHAGSVFVAVGCAALSSAPDSGRFSSRLAEAAGGTLFLDEVGELPPELQAVLLQFLEAQEADGGLHLPRRIIAATRDDLQAAVAEGSFREDLYYRLNVLGLPVPPLRERQGDVDMLAQYFFARYAAEKSRNVRGFTRHALHRMNQHDWPGNVRELMNRVRRAMVMCERRLIGPGDLGLERRTEQRHLMTLEQARTAAEKEVIRGALKRARNNVSRAAQELGVSRVTLYRLMEKCGIAP